MKTDPRFKQPNAIKNQRPKDQPKDGVNTPWDFRAPCYDERSSNFVNAGTHYGVAHRQPVGHEGNPKTFVDTLPFGNHPTMETDEVG
jgi:hypothetical protein